MLSQFAEDDDEANELYDVQEDARDDGRLVETAPGLMRPRYLHNMQVQVRRPFGVVEQHNILRDVTDGDECGDGEPRPFSACHHSPRAHLVDMNGPFYHQNPR